VCVLQAATKEGFLMKQTWSFQRWRRRYFKLKGRKLYYAKDTKVRRTVWDAYVNLYGSFAAVVAYTF
jgi:hypothetical protein